MEPLAAARTGHTAVAATAGAGALYTLMRANPALSRMAGAASILSGVSGLGVRDEVQTSRLGSVAQIAGGAGLLFARTPVGFARATIVAVAGAGLNIASERGWGGAPEHRNMIRGAVMGTAVGMAAGLRPNGIALAAAGMVVGSVAGALIGHKVDESRSFIAPETIMPLVRLSPQLAPLLR